MTEREKRIEEMIYKVYLDNESGGALHIVIGDGNFEDNHIKYCLECSIPKIENDEKRSLYAECAKGLLSLKLSRRYSLASSAWNIYRKANEVRKETELRLKRLLLVLCNRQHNYYPSIDSYFVSEKVVKLDDIKEQFKKFGVEVEE